MWARLLRTGVQRGLFGGSRAWTVVAAVAGLVRLAKWVNREKVVYSEELKPGQALIIANDRDAVMMEG